MFSPSLGSFSISPSVSASVLASVRTRYYVPVLAHPFMAVAGCVLSLSSMQHHHFLHVLRGRSNDYLRLFHPDSGEWLAVVHTLSKQSLCVRLLEPLASLAPKPFQLTLFFSPLKKDAMDFLLHKGCELGVDTFVPVITHRTEAHNIQRTLKSQILIDAAELSGRRDIPQLLSAISLDTIGVYGDGMTIFVADETRKDPSLLALAMELYQPLCHFGLLIGPEGGFDDIERSHFSSLGLLPVSLGSFILKAETAAIAGVSTLVSLGEYYEKR